MTIFKLMAIAVNEIPDVLRGGGKGTVAPIATPPPLAPEPETMETLQDTPEAEYKKQAKTQGAKSLQIPLGTVGSSDVLNK